MAWFRWHIGCVTNPKFALVAKKTDSKVCEVIAVWALLLERASASEDRGDFGELSEETVEFLLDLSEGQLRRIMTAMTAIGLIADSRIANWDKRQPKRERETEVPGGSTGRVRKHRAAKKAEAEATEEPAIQPEKSSIPPCPHQEILDKYSEILPELPQPRIWSETDKKHLSARWKWVLTAKKRSGERYAETSEQGVEWFVRFFDFVRECDHLMGKNDRQWNADLKWLIKESNFDKVISGNYRKDSQ